MSDGQQGVLAAGFKVTKNPCEKGAGSAGLMVGITLGLMFLGSLHPIRRRLFKRSK